MNYTKKPIPGDVLLCRRNSFLSRAILFFQKIRKKHTRWTHVAQCVDIWGETYIVDAQKNGVNPRPFKEWMKEFGYDFQIVRPKSQFFRSPTFYKIALSKVGSTKYDFASLLLWQPLYIITGKWRGKQHNRATGRMYCSEYIGWLHSMPEWWKMSPQDVADWMKKSIDYVLIKSL